MRVTYKDGYFIYMNALTDSLFMYNPQTNFLRYENMSERQLRKVYKKMKKLAEIYL